VPRAWTKVIAEPAGGRQLPLALARIGRGRLRDGPGAHVDRAHRVRAAERKRSDRVARGTAEWVRNQVARLWAKSCGQTTPGIGPLRLSNHSPAGACLGVGMVKAASRAAPARLKLSQFRRSCLSPAAPSPWRHRHTASRSAATDTGGIHGTPCPVVAGLRSGDDHIHLKGRRSPRSHWPGTSEAAPVGFVGASPVE